MEKFTCQRNKPDKFYQYWEDFIKQWSNPMDFNTSKKICDWTAPCQIPLYNDPLKKDLSSDYVPEPWWGNDGSQPLHCVVVNFNPGKGGEDQMRDIIPYKLSYAHDIVNNYNFFHSTRCWHWSKRAKPILSILKERENIKDSLGLQHYLSVELIPWHTEKVNPGYWKYLKNNIEQVYYHTICFAAYEARRIANKTLNSVVILKLSGACTQRLVKELKRNNIDAYIKESKNDDNGTNYTKSKKGAYLQFFIKEWSDIKFFSIWGPHSHNEFPPDKDLNEIINVIINSQQTRISQYQ